MTAFNIVRYRVKPENEERFLEAHRHVQDNFPGFQGFHQGSLIKTGEHSYCFIGEWDNFDTIQQAEADMVGLLDEFRDTLEDLGNQLGVTDPVAGNVVMNFQ